jgi:hypothetical protein
MRGVFVLAAALALAACETTAEDRDCGPGGTRYKCLTSVLANPYAAPGAKQLAYQQLLVMWSQATPASDENTHKLIQEFARQPQTVVVPVGPAW